MTATPKEDIERQHQEAVDMVNSSMPYAPMVNIGEISLRWKETPTVEQEMFHSSKPIQEETPELDVEENTIKTKSSVESKETICISSRGIVDVSSIAKLVIEGCHEPANTLSQSTTTKLKEQPVKSKTNLWDEINAAVSNVHVIRPSHDAWGIKKIVLIFCDDFLQTVYEMPWWHKRPDIRKAVQPILDLLNVEPNRIVRMLLAALPPSTTIPVHHDTGEWVKHTHRVHVPIIIDNPDKILFRCGPTATRMQRVNCVPGHVFEMNNQGKHAVSNCHAELYRVHLILDYVDPSFHIQERIKLSPGEVVLQTRRSIDRAIDKGKRRTPSFMIIGAQKSGTTSIYEYLNQHPLVVRAKRRETHCLDWRWNDSLETTAEQRDHCLSFFNAKELKFHPSCMTGDSTPSYLLDSYRCIPRLKKIFTHGIKFIVIMRDPVKRAKSHYEMVTSNDGTPEQIQNRGTEWLNLSFREVVELDFKNMKAAGLIPYWDIDSQTMDLDKFHDFVGSRQEDLAFQNYLRDYVVMNSGSHSLIVRGLYELQLRQWYKSFSNDSFLLLKLEDMKDNGVQSTMKKVYQHLHLPEIKVEDDSAKNTRSYSSEIDADLKQMLQRFYTPHNERMHLLSKSKEWLGNPW